MKEMMIYLFGMVGYAIVVSCLFFVIISKVMQKVYANHISKEFIENTSLLLSFILLLILMILY